MKYMSMAVLALMGAVMSGCSSDDELAGNVQPAKQGNVVTVTTTVGLGGDEVGNRALAVDYDAKTLTKSFAVDEQIAIIYENTSGNLDKAESAALTAGDISADGKSATFTVTMTDPKASGTVKYIYPVVMAGATDVDYSMLYYQTGTLTNLATLFDLATFDGTLTAESALPASAPLTNQLAIVAFTLKDADGTNDITSTITEMTINDGTNTYTISGGDSDGRIYAAIRPTSGADIEYTATDGSKNYTKSVTGKTYAAGEFYQLGLRMAEAAAGSNVDLSTLSADYEAQNGDVLTGTLGGNYKISIADNATVTLDGVTINGVNNSSYSWAGITCAGDATIILSGSNTVKGFYEDYPGIHVPTGKTLTIKGSGSLDASSNGYGAGIGGGYQINCGNIEIQGGTITATGSTNAAGIGGGYSSCGTITISGGTIIATGGQYGAGIGSGSSSSCGTITISGGTITATGGRYAAGIGSGGLSSSSCGTITISGGTIDATGGDSAAGIGGGGRASCGDITIANTVTKVTATMGDDADGSADGSIGAGYSGTCGTVTIGGTVYYDGMAYQNGGDTYLTTSPLVYQP